MFARTDRPRAASAGHAEIIRLRRSLIRLQDETRLLRRDVLRRKYNPSQPRVPAGSSGGGQWTSGAGGGGHSGVMPGFGEGGDLAEFAPGDGFVIDETGEEAWAFYQESFDDDGALAERAVVNRDGSTIHSEYADSHEVGFDERHTVTTPEGEKATFETAGPTQTIREGGPGGEIVSRSVWTPGGPEFDATVKPAFAPLVAAPAIIIGGAILFGWESPFNGDDGQQAVMGFNARDFRVDETAGSALDLSYVGQISQAEAEAACKYLPELQSRLDRAVSAAGPLSNYPHPAIYGTVIHHSMKNQVDDARYPDLHAERSFAKEAADATPDEFVRYGYPRSVRVDAYELRNDGTLCIYDFKTGKRGIPIGRVEMHLIRLMLELVLVWPLR